MAVALTFPPNVARRLKRRVYKQLREQGFVVDNGAIGPHQDAAKEAVRSLHLTARAEKAMRELESIGHLESDLIREFADGSDVDPDAIDPEITEVSAGSFDSCLYRYASLLWSVPVSQGFGRRKRFLVRDRANGCLIGLFALGDPVFNLSCRDDYIGWDSEQRKERLYNVMDLFVLGAVPPYNTLLGGKLVAYLATSNEVRKRVEKAYHRRETVIQSSAKHGGLALLTTSSALGRSALYSRIKYDKRPLYEPIGETKGWGHFHLNHGLFEELVSAMEEHAPGRATRNRFGNGPNWKIRTAREALRMAGVSPDILQHGIRRQVFVIHVSENAKAFLRGEHKNLRRYDIPHDAVVEHWKSRWLHGRVERKPEFQDWTAKEILRSVRTGTRLRPPRIQAKLGDD